MVALECGTYLVDTCECFLPILFGMRCLPGGHVRVFVFFPSLLACRAAGLDLTLADFQSVSDRVPFLADLKPSGKYVMEDVHKVGGTPAVLKYLLEKGLIDGSCMTGENRTVAMQYCSH